MLIFGGFKSPLGSKLEAQDPPKSRPKPEKIDVEKQHIFGIDFGRVRTSFWNGFWKVFWIEDVCQKRTFDFCEKLTKHCVGAWNLRFGSCNKQPKISKNQWKIACFLKHRFGRHFGWILGQFWEAKIHDFRNFFDVFSKSFLKHTREEQKNRFKRPENAEGANLVTGFRSSQPSWGEKKRGV